MEWFKHFSDNHRGRSIQNLMDELGHTGLCYFLLMEMCAEKFTKRPHENATEADCLFSFHRRIIRQSLRISRTNLQHLLYVCTLNGLLSWKIDGETIEISMPILLDLRQKDTRNATRRRLTAASKTPQELELELEKNKSKNKSYKAPQVSNIELNRKVWQAYSDAYKQRYKVEPTRNGMVNGQISQLAKRLGDDAIEIVKFYLTHNDGFYLSKTHSIGPCLRDAETLKTQWLRKKPITRNTIRQFEQVQQYEETARHIQEHGV